MTGGGDYFFSLRAAIKLLGKYESAFKLRHAVAQVSWTRRDKNQKEVDYKHFTVPFILTVYEYDDYTIREVLHNCIAIRATLFNSVSTSWRIHNICIIPTLAHSSLALWKDLICELRPFYDPICPFEVEIGRNFITKFSVTYISSNSR